MKEVCPTILSDSHGTPHAACIGVDLYNQTTTGGVAKTLSNKATDSDHIPCVITHGVTTKGNGEVILTEERHMSISVGGDKPDKATHV